MSRTARITLLTFVGVVVALLLLAGGFFFGMSPEFGGRLQQILPSGCASSSTASVDENLQEEVLQKLEGNYYKEIDPAQLSKGAIDGMVASLNDRWTVYLDPQEYSDLKLSLSQSYSGVGMTMELVDGLVVIVSTFEGSPAALAGIRPGDLLVSIDGSPVDGMKIEEVASKVRGPENTSVTVGIYRPPVTTTTTTTEQPGVDESSESTTTTVGLADTTHLPPGGTTLEFTLTRKTISVPVTRTEIVQDGTKKVAHIGFATFSEGSADALRNEVRKAVETDKVDAIILDLRSNGGGIVGEAVGVASIFIDKGQRIVSTEGLHSPEQVLDATGNAYTQIPLYVLTDQYTASASEIVSGALQDYKRATLVGGTTFGKGLVQIIEPLSNGGAIKITSAVYLTPNGRDLNKTGITPDVVAPDDPATPDVDETLQKTLDLIAGAAASQ